MIPPPPVAVVPDAGSPGEVLDLAKVEIAGVDVGGGFPAAYLGTNMPPLDFHGFASQGFLATSKYNYLDTDTKKGSFRYTEAGLNVSMNPFPRTRITAQGFLYFNRKFRQIGGRGPQSCGRKFRIDMPFGPHRPAFTVVRTRGITVTFWG